MKTKLLYDFKYIEDTTRGYRKSQLFNSALPSTYQERFHFKRKAIRDDILGIIYLAVGIFCAWMIAAGFSG